MDLIKRGAPIEIVNTYPNYAIRSLEDFPNRPTDGVIYLDADTSYMIYGTVDLLGLRIVCKGIVSIFGSSSETAYLQSTGLAAGRSLISTAYSLPIQNITIQSVGAGRVFDVDGGGTAAIDWVAFNIVDCEIGTIRNVSNFIVSNSAWFDCYGIIFSDGVGTVSFDLSLLTTAAGQTLISIDSSVVITRRFRVLFSSVLVPVGSVGIALAVGASIPVDMFILTDVGFSGGSLDYLTGITALDNRARFSDCRGIDNSANTGYYAMDNNNVATDIPSANTFVKIAGNTSAGILQRFTHTNNRLTYDGILVRTFGFWATASGLAGSNNTLQLQIRRYNSANVLQEVSASTRSTTSGNNRAENMTTFIPMNMQPNDYIEVWISNSNATNVTVTELIVMIR